MLIVLTIFPPGEMMVIKSVVLLFCADAPDGTLSVVSPEKDLPDGSVLS